MSNTWVFLISFGLIILGYGTSKLHQAIKELPVPVPDMNRNWGAENKNDASHTKIEPFKINFGEAEVEKLKLLLEDTSYFPSPLEGVNFEYGMNTNILKQIVTYWRQTYLEKWTTERQPHLNKFPQYKTRIQGLDIHYIHVKPNVADDITVYPLLMLHGWPGSVVEFYDIIPMLTSISESRNYTFEIIAPSLPGYGFSDAATKQGLDYAEIAIIFQNLMKRLGKDRYFVQGGDWGAMVGTTMATLFSENIIGFHSNMCATQNPVAIMFTTVASLFPSFFVEDKKYTEWYFPLSNKFKEIIKESGYMHIQGTKPDTIGIALSKNPIGLAAYILEKFVTWTNPNYREVHDGHLFQSYNIDKLLDNIMVYYMTNSILTSQRLYKESLSSTKVQDYERMYTMVPTGCAKFRYELLNQPDCVLKTKFKLIHSSFHDDGGHFAAMQLPKVLYQDVLEFVDKVLK